MTKNNEYIKKLEAENNRLESLLNTHIMENQELKKQIKTLQDDISNQADYYENEIRALQPSTI